MLNKIVSIIFVFMFAATTHAGQVGGLSSNVGQGNVFLSSTLAYLSKDVEADGNTDEMTARQIILKGDYGLLSNLDLYFLLGFSDLEIGDFEGRLDTLLGTGIKFRLFKDTSDRINVMLNGDIMTFSSSDSGTDVDVTDFGVSMLVINKSGNITPYAGIRFSDTWVDIEGTPEDLTSDKNIGVIGGIDYFVNPNVFFNGEVNIFDQEAIFLTAGYKF